MGHASITTTLGPYGRPYSGDIDRYADQLNTAARNGHLAVAHASSSCAGHAVTIAEAPA
jgi:hypothetical protein